LVFEGYLILSIWCI